MDLTQGKVDAVIVDPVTGGREYISEAIQERKDQIRDDMTIGEMFSDLVSQGERYGDANRQRFDDPPELFGKRVPSYEDRRREEDPRYQELFRMRDEYQREVDKRDMKSGIRSLFDFAGIPTDEASVEVATSGIPIYSLLEALSDGRLSELLGEVGQSEPIDFEAVLTEYGASPEIAGLGALAAGMTKGRGTGSIFDGLRGAMDPSTIKKYDDKEFMDFQKGVEDADNQLSGKTVGKDEFAELDAMIERGLKPKGEGIPNAPYRGPSARYARLSNEGKKKMQDLLNKRNRLRGELMEDDFMGAERELDLQRQIEVLEDQLRPFFPIDRMATGGRPGLYANIHAKRKRIAAGSGERMRRKGEEGAPTAENFRQAAKTEKKNMGGRPGTRRRKRMMVPASYKTGGQVFQKGYYGKSYK